MNPFKPLKELYAWQTVCVGGESSKGRLHTKEEKERGGGRRGDRRGEERGGGGGGRGLGQKKMSKKQEREREIKTHM